MRFLKAFLGTAVYLLALQLVDGSSIAFKNGTLPCHRLPINVRPTKYDLHLKFPSLDSQVYEGHVDISVEYLKRSKKLVAEWNLEEVECAQEYEENVIVMHADKSLEIEHIEVTSQPFLQFICGGEQKQREIVEVVRDEAKQMMAIRVKRGIYASKQGTAGKISISFRGRMRNDKRGVYVSTYNDGQQVYKAIVSQFQPTDARTVFPCFDEPRFRVPFSVRLSHPKGLTAYGNAEVAHVLHGGELASTVFSTTPDMPIHMVAFTIGQFDEPLEAISLCKGKKRKVRVITAPGKRETGRFALGVAFRSLNWFEDYIDYRFPLEKLDVIAIADHDKDNTESWGLVFVRDTLLWIDDETLPETRITAAVNVAHVVVHQWFGNLISANWWSDLWITEGVAAQFAFKIVQEIYNLQSEYFVRLATLSGVMQADQPGKLHSLSPPAKDFQTSEQIYGIFDVLEFMKSASLAQMTEETIGSSNYQLVLRELVKERAYKTITFADYKYALSSPDVELGGSRLMDLLSVLDTFPKYAGVPLVSCHIEIVVEGPRLKMTLEPYANMPRNIFAGPALQGQEVFIKVETVVSGGTQHEANQVQIISASGKEVANRRRLPRDFDLVSPDSDHYIKVDREPTFATYYRTRYSELLYKHLEIAISRKLISAMDRIQILDDANQLVQADLIELAQFKSLLDSYADETDPAVVLAILTATGTYKRLAGDDSVFMPSDAAIVHMFEEYGFDITGSEQVTLQRARTDVLKTLILKGNQAALAGALEAFDKDGLKLALFLREPVYTAVVLSASERVNKLLDHLAETKSYEEKIRLLKALTLSKDKEVLQRVKSWLASSGLKPETTKPFLDAIEAGISHQ